MAVAKTVEFPVIVFDILLLGMSKDRQEPVNKLEKNIHIQQFDKRSTKGRRDEPAMD